MCSDTGVSQEALSELEGGAFWKEDSLEWTLTLSVTLPCHIPINPIKIFYIIHVPSFTSLILSVQSTEPSSVKFSVTVGATVVTLSVDVIIGQASAVPPPAHRE